MSTEAGIRTIITELHGVAPARVTAGAALADLGFDILARAELMLEIEADFHVFVTWRAIRTARTVDDVVAHVDRRLAESGSFRLRAAA